MMRRIASPVPIRAGLLLSLVVLVTGCGSGSVAGSDSGGPGSQPPSPTATATANLDSIAVLGHSGATGTRSDPSDPARDAYENSWATGENPEVQSIYLRLLADHPDLEGHNYNHAVNGSSVDDLLVQFGDLLKAADPVPDVLLIQTVDNDMRCDGSDPDHYGPFGDTLDRALTQMQAAIPGVQFFIVGPWATVEAWTGWASHHQQHVVANSGTGPCDVFDGEGNPRPEGIGSLQEIVDAYWGRVEQVCAARTGCFTDGGAQQADFVPTDEDVAEDLNHLSIAGHHKYAAIAWAAFPEEIKNRP